MPTKKTTKGKVVGKKKAGGKAKVKVGTKDPNSDKVLVGQATGPPPKTIKMLVSLANERGSFQRDLVYRVPHDVGTPTARNWVRSGAAEKLT